MCRWGCTEVNTVYMCKWCGTRYCKACGRGEFVGTMSSPDKCRVCFQGKCQGQLVEFGPRGITSSKNKERSTPSSTGKSATSKRSSSKNKSAKKKKVRVRSKQR